ncbi:MAG TPA: hypothetical protein VGQ59_20925 [Cyclobacteriaceae bacterium]|jgi:hypothetical protein|nr:hypothetical protein [Cyclobacteriaceae bacterium]
MAIEQKGRENKIHITVPKSQENTTIAHIQAIAKLFTQIMETYDSFMKKWKAILGISFARAG